MNSIKKKAYNTLGLFTLCFLFFHFLVHNSPFFFFFFALVFLFMVLQVFNFLFFVFATRIFSWCQVHGLCAFGVRSGTKGSYVFLWYSGDFGGFWCIFWNVGGFPWLLEVVSL